MDAAGMTMRASARILAEFRRPRRIADGQAASLSNVRSTANANQARERDSFARDPRAIDWRTQRRCLRSARVSYTGQEFRPVLFLAYTAPLASVTPQAMAFRRRAACCTGPTATSCKELDKATPMR